MDSKHTQIQVTKETVERLKANRLTKRESYDEQVNRLLSHYLICQKKKGV